MKLNIIFTLGLIILLSACSKEDSIVTETMLNFEDLPQVDFRISVLDENESPISEAELTIFANNEIIQSGIFTNETGIAFLDANLLLQHSDLTIKASKSGWIGQTIFIDETATYNDGFELRMANTSNVPFLVNQNSSQLVNPILVSGKVEDQNGNGIENTFVFYVSNDNSNLAITNADGNYSLLIESDVSYAIFAIVLENSFCFSNLLPSYQSFNTQNTIAPIHTIQVDGTTETFNGVLHDCYGNIQSNFSFYIQEIGQTVSTNANGEFTFDALDCLVQNTSLTILENDSSYNVLLQTDYLVGNDFGVLNLCNYSMTQNGFLNISIPNVGQINSTGQVLIENDYGLTLALYISTDYLVNAMIVYDAQSLELLSFSFADANLQLEVNIDGTNANYQLQATNPVGTNFSTNYSVSAQAEIINYQNIQTENVTIEFGY